jgi:tRNA A-37 threonylcarbamoyl transferase component Bud32/ribosomal protein S27E
MSADSTSPPRSPADLRLIDGVCDRFECAWQSGTPALEDYLAEAPPELRSHLLAELASIELQYRNRLQSKEFTFDDLIAAHPAIAEELNACRDAVNSHESDRPTDRGASDVVLASIREPQGLHIRCPHCASPVELLADTPDEDVTCRACGSTFCLVDRGGDAATPANLRSIGRFELLSRLGVGGFGTVWKARDPELDRTVALKIPRRGQLRSEEIDFFFREARAAAQLRHPNIVAVYEIGREDDTVFIVSDFIRGVTLSDWMSTQKPSARDVAELCTQVAHALEHAHERGVVHRDLKPSNIMIDEGGQPRIMDFGLAKRESGEITMTCDGQILGTAAYMSPEQAEGRGHWIDRRADVYSLGVVMFQMATGELPYRGNFEVQLTSKLLDDAPDPRKLNRHIPRDFATVCLKCLERDPNRRYAGAGALAADLRRFLKGEPVVARPLSRAARLARWAKRKPALATAALLAAVLAVTGPIVAIVIDAQRRQLDRQVDELDKLVIEQQDELQVLRKESSRLMADLASREEANPGHAELLEWRRSLIDAVLERRLVEARTSLSGDSLDQGSRAQLQLALGMMLTAVERREEAEEQFIGAQSSLEALAESDAADRRVVAALADCYEQLATLRHAAGRKEDATQVAARALELRRRLAGSSAANAAARVDLLAAHGLLPQDVESLKEIPALSEQVIADWPDDPAAIYEAACRLTLRTPWLSEVMGGAASE